MNKREKRILKDITEVVEAIQHLKTDLRPISDFCLLNGLNSMKGTEEYKTLQRGINAMKTAENDTEYLLYKYKLEIGETKLKDLITNN